MTYYLFCLFLFCLSLLSCYRYYVILFICKCSLFFQIFYFFYLFICCAHYLFVYFYFSTQIKVYVFIYLNVCYVTLFTTLSKSLFCSYSLFCHSIFLPTTDAAKYLCPMCNKIRKQKI
jgi:hypothetical protein